MANQQFNLFELKAGLCRHSVVRRLFQFWKAQNVKSWWASSGTARKEGNEYWSSFCFISMYSFRKKVITCSVEWFAVHFDSSLNQCPSAQYFQKHFEARQAVWSKWVWCNKDQPKLLPFRLPCINQFVLQTQTKFHEFPENNGTPQVPG